MKRIVFFVAALLSISYPALAEEWVMINKTPGHDYYVESGSIQVDEIRNLARYWLMDTRSTPIVSDRIKYSTVISEHTMDMRQGIDVTKTLMLQQGPKRSGITMPLDPGEIERPVVRGGTLWKIREYVQKSRKAARRV